MIRSVPNCRPECLSNSDCDSSKACLRQKCVDPCPGSCGLNSQCHVRSHSPVRDKFILILNKFTLIVHYFIRHALVYLVTLVMRLEDVKLLEVSQNLNYYQ